MEGIINCFSCSLLFSRIVCRGCSVSQAVGISSRENASNTKRQDICTWDGSELVDRINGWWKTNFRSPYSLGSALDLFYEDYFDGNTLNIRFNSNDSFCIRWKGVQLRDKFIKYSEIEKERGAIKEQLGQLKRNLEERSIKITTEHYLSLIWEFANSPL